MKYAPSVFFVMASVRISAAQTSTALPINDDTPCRKYVQSNNTQPIESARWDEAKSLYSNALVITAHDHCYATADFGDQQKAGISARIVALETDGEYWTGGKMVDDGSGDQHSDVGVYFKTANDAICRFTGCPYDGPHIRDIRVITEPDQLNGGGGKGLIISFEGARVCREEPYVDYESASSLYGERNRSLQQQCLQHLVDLRNAGMRVFQLYWTTLNPLKQLDTFRCNQNPDPQNKRPPYCEAVGLSDLGVRVIEELNELGIVIDLAHMGPVPLTQALALVKHPILVSHAAVAYTSLNDQYDAWQKDGRTDDLYEGSAPGGAEYLDDNTIKAIVSNGGVIGLHFLSSFVRAQGSSSANIEALVDEIKHVERFDPKLEHVALGPDFMPLELKPGQEPHWVAQPSDFPAIVYAMLQRNIGREQIKNVLGENLLRLFRCVWTGQCQAGNPAKR